MDVPELNKLNQYIQPPQLHAALLAVWIGRRLDVHQSSYKAVVSMSYEHVTQTGHSAPNGKVEPLHPRNVRVSEKSDKQHVYNFHI